MVTFIRSLPLTLLFVTWACLAEEGTILIDTTKGIDTTYNPTVNTLKDISESLQDDEAPSSEDIESVVEETPDTIEDIVGPTSEPVILIDNTRSIDNTVDSEPVTTESFPDSSPEGTSEPTLLIDNTRGIDNIESLAPVTTETSPVITPDTTSDQNVLIDKTKGIDKTADPDATEIKAITKSLEDIDKPVIKPAVTPVAAPVIAPVIQPPVKAAESKPKPVLPPIKPRPPETKEQKVAIEEKWAPKDNDLRLLEVRIAQFKLEDVIPAYKYENVVLVPIGLLSELLDIAVTTEPGLARGFVLKEDWTFMLDIARTEVVLQGKPEPYNKSLVHELEDDIYVESGLLSKWFHMNLDINLFSSRMWITSEEKLPFVKRMEREQRISKSLARLKRTQKEYPEHHEPYKNWSIPFIDQTVGMGLAKTNAGSTDLTYNYTTHVAADLLKHESTWFLIGDDDELIDEFRATMSRHDNNAELLGFMKASTYAFGNVSEPRLSMITSSGSLEPGVAVNNYPLGRQIEYDRKRFRGTLLPGWEVELYQNNVLIGYQGAPVKGLYDFPDIPILFGNNHFRLVFYGPQGQIREEEEHLNLNQSLTKKGEHYYNATATTDEGGGNRTTAQYDYGITENISSSLAFVSIPLDEWTTREQHTYTKAGIRGFWDSYLMSLDFITDSASGSAFQIDVQTQFDDAVVGFKDIELSEFFSEEFLPTSAQLSRRTNININTGFTSSSFQRIPVDFGIRRDEFANGGDLLELTNRLSVSTHGYAASNFLTRQTTSGQDPVFTGSFQLSTNVDRYSLRGTINYELQPDAEISSFSSTLDAGEYKGYNISYGLSHSLDQGVTDYNVSANKSTGKYNLSLGARYNSNNEFYLNATLSIGFGYEPRRHQWDSKAGTIANQGSVSARVFLDNNQDGIYGENDEPLEDIRFTLNSGYSADKTAEDGIVFLTGLAPYEPTNVVISPETMSDPLWTSALEGIQVTPRPGHAILLEFPVFTSGEIDGTVYLRKNNKEFGVGKVTIELVDAQGRTLKTAETAYDGFYVMSNIPLGEYRLRVSNEQLENLGLNQESDQLINIKSDEPFLNGIDFTLSPK